MSMRSRTWLLVLILACACSVSAGELAEKAAKFDRLVAAEHMPRGLVVNLQPIGAGEQLRYRSAGDSTIWTGAYIVSQVFRYRVTRDEEALDNIEKCLRAFVQLHDMAGRQGFIGRAFGTREELGDGRDVVPGVGSYSHLCFKADTSRDQYTGIFMGCGLAWDYIRDVKLRSEVSEMIATAAHNLMNNNLALKVKINGLEPSTFNLNPEYAYQDRINPEEWAKVDDFPANVFAQALPYSERLARTVARFRPPAVRGGEALRALLMLQTACNISGDEQLKSFFEGELLARRELHIVASETAKLLEDVFMGRNLVVVENRLNGIFVAVGRVFVQIMAMRAGVPESLALWLEPLTDVAVVGKARQFTANLMTMLAFLREPGSFKVFAAVAAKLEGHAATLRMFKAEKAAKRLEDRAKRLRSYATSNLDEFSDTMRSYVGCNLGFFALLGILEQTADNRVRQAALAILPRALEPIADEGNSMYSLIEAAHTGRKYDDPLVVQARRTLQLYPEDQTNRRFDHSGSMRHSLWPDRFGRYGRQSVELIPIDQRAPHIFIWQEPPRSMVTGADDQTRIAPVGYLLAYWYGRFHNLINEAD
ncbi:MAG: hypothetical protein GQF41_0233 [Candidatus Rifleibacterium amylolyticum]|nr:MAG: hypothetical protein GQF41_0233 [Candidatus Rifleibacterium amylolyticum]NLF98326.1 hypothetical protein [Candidatus Riflebacteria bacterium]